MQAYPMIPYSLSEDENDFSSLETSSLDKSPLHEFPKLGFWILVRWETGHVLQRSFRFESQIPISFESQMGFLWISNTFSCKT